jgi:hypothetical protein
MSLVETLISIVVIASISLTILPALASIRDNSLNEMSKANLMAIGQGRDQYAMENKDRIFTYTWRAGEAYMLPTGQVRTHQTDLDASTWQNTEILQRRTGRISGEFKIQSGFGRIPHRRFSHLILLDDHAISDEAFHDSQLGIDPADENLLTWHERTLEYRDGSGVPYSDGYPGVGYDDDGNWTSQPVRARWRFSSSYQIVPHAWQGDGDQNVYTPVQDTPHLFIASNGDAILGRRHMSEVAFPSKKVHMHEEFDYEQNRHPYFAYDHARPEKLMFDGSINSRPSGEANPSVSPEDYEYIDPELDPYKYLPLWTQRYVPLDTFPIPLGGFNDNTELSMRYRWTLYGLQGVDYE